MRLSLYGRRISSLSQLKRIVRCMFSIRLLVYIGLIELLIWKNYLPTHLFIFMLILIISKRTAQEISMLEHILLMAVLLFTDGRRLLFQMKMETLSQIRIQQEKIFMSRLRILVDRLISLIIQELKMEMMRVEILFTNILFIQLNHSQLI